MLHAGEPQLQVSANDLVRQTIAQEVAAADHPKHAHMFRSRRETPKGTQTKLYIETKDAMAGMLIAVNDQPVSPYQLQGEKDRLAGLAGNPDQLRKKHTREKEDADRTLRILKALPDAFRFEYAGTEKATSELGKTGEELVKLNFTPNPAYSPPSHVEQVLQGMQGYVLIDGSARRLALIDGVLFREVTFGWGIIGHLDRGGHFRVQQADVGDGCWDITSMNLKMTGKILMFKSLSMISDEKFSDFRAVPETLTFAQGVQMLENEQEKLARNRAPQAAATEKRQ
ncbi:MAG TPA: hypothetical protein VMU05_03200 [Dongiaceae bacterium]|nr:hypothetical protein [Dongiaceae bacterium]